MFTYDDWIAGDALEVGRWSMIGLSPARQVARAAAVLERCRSRLPAVPAVEHVATLAVDSARWVDGHRAFGAVRTLTLQEERERTSDLYRALLYVAEIVAKIIYSASRAPAPFDSDSPDWLARNARDFARAHDDDAFSRQVWQALTV